MDCLLVKLGGSLITDKSKPLSLRPSALALIASELAGINKKYPDKVLILGNGAGSFGHYMVEKVNYRQNPDNQAAIKAVRDSVAELNIHVVNALKSAGIDATSLPPSSFIKEKSGQLVCDLTELKKIIKRGAVPVVYGDVINVDKKSSRVISTEEVFNTLGTRLVNSNYKIEKVIFATSAAGVLDKNGSTIKQLRKKDKLHIKAKEGFDVTGGMAQKVKMGFSALAYTPNVYIVSGRKVGEVLKAIRGEAVGTQLVR